MEAEGETNFSIGSCKIESLVQEHISKINVGSQFVLIKIWVMHHSSCVHTSRLSPSDWTEERVQLIIQLYLKVSITAG